MQATVKEIYILSFNLIVETHLLFIWFLRNRFVDGQSNGSWGEEDKLSVRILPSPCLFIVVLIPFQSFLLTPYCWLLGGPTLKLVQEGHVIRPLRSSRLPEGSYARTLFPKAVRLGPIFSVSYSWELCFLHFQDWRKRKYWQVVSLKMSLQKDTRALTQCVPMDVCVTPIIDMSCF